MLPQSSAARADDQNQRSADADAAAEAVEAAKAVAAPGAGSGGGDDDDEDEEGSGLVLSSAAADAVWGRMRQYMREKGNRRANELFMEVRPHGLAVARPTGARAALLGAASASTVALQTRCLC